MTSYRLVMLLLLNVASGVIAAVKGEDFKYLATDDPVLTRLCDMPLPTRFTTLRFLNAMLQSTRGGRLVAWFGAGDGIAWQCGR